MQGPRESTEIVIVFPLLELPPRISNLRAFKRRCVEERPGVFELLAVLTKEDVMMNAFGPDAGSTALAVSPTCVAWARLTVIASANNVILRRFISYSLV
jgi:hypothetical protein